jgi:hypothetical protein
MPFVNAASAAAVPLTYSLQCRIPDALGLRPMCALSYWVLAKKGTTRFAFIRVGRFTPEIPGAAF